MPSYRSHEFQGWGIEVKVRPTGWRRLWGLRWWFPYFTGSDFKLAVVINTPHRIRVSAAMRSDLATDQSMLESTLCEPGDHRFEIDYPGNIILPDGPSRANVTISVFPEDSKPHDYDLVAAKFIAWDPDEFIFRRLVPFTIFVGATVSIGLLAGN